MNLFTAFALHLFAVLGLLAIVGFLVWQWFDHFFISVWKRYKTGFDSSMGFFSYWVFRTDLANFSFITLILSVLVLSWWLLGGHLWILTKMVAM